LAVLFILTTPTLRIVQGLEWAERPRVQLNPFFSLNSPA
jgi:hypothetical protein